MALLDLQGLTAQAGRNGSIHAVASGLSLLLCSDFSIDG
ncbi:SapB/AmfS family lanthipeptide [Kribbella sp. NPDC056861]